MKLRVSILFALLAGLALGWWYCHENYSATAKIDVRCRELAPITLGMVYDSSRSPTSQEAQNVMEVIESPDVMSPVIADLKLDRIWGQRFHRGGFMPMEEALKHLADRLRLYNQPGTRIYEITVTSDVSREAASIANAIAEQYKAMRDHEEDQLSASGITVLKDQIAQQEQHLKDAEAKAKQNPVDKVAQRMKAVAQNMLDALKVKLQQDESDAKSHESPVRIVSRAG